MRKYGRIAFELLLIINLKETYRDSAGLFFLLNSVGEPNSSNGDFDMIYENILDTIGNTPIVKLNSLQYSKNVNIYAKIEGMNPSGSIKDRIALNLIRKAISDGKLTKDKTIIEASSGNTGISLASVAAILGYKIIIVMSESVSIERRKILKAFGAEIILTSATEGTDGAIRKAQQIVNKNPELYYLPDQYSNSANPDSHFNTTAKEIWDDTNGNIDYFVSAIGTGGTITGIAKYLKQKNPNIKIIAAQPIKGHNIQGLKNMQESVVPAIYEASVIDKTIVINDEEAFSTARYIARNYGILVGMSSGAALFAAQTIANSIGKGNIVTIFPDRGEKYLSTALFD